MKEKTLSIKEYISQIKRAMKKSEFKKAYQLNEQLLQQQPTNVYAKKTKKKLEKIVSTHVGNQHLTKIDELIGLFESEQYTLSTKLARQLLLEESDNRLILNILAGSYLKTGNYEKAEAVFKQMIHLYEDSALVYHNYGLLLLELKKYSEAIMQFSKAIFLDNCYLDAYKNRANTYYLQQQWQLAIEDYRKIVEIQPDFKNCNNLAILYKKTGQFHQSIKLYEQAIQLCPEDASIYNNLGIVYKEINQLDQAVIFFKKALSLMPDYAECYSNYANVAVLLGDETLAMQLYEKSLSYNRNNPECLNNLASLLQKLGNKKQALVYLERAIQLKPDYATAYNNYANVLQDMRQFDLSIDYYKKAIALQPDYAEACANLAKVYLTKGEKKTARLYFDKSIYHYPQNPETFHDISSLVNFGDEPFLFKQLEALKLKQDFTDEQKMHLSYALFKAYDDLDRIDEAFSALRSANNLHSQLFVYKQKKQTAYFDLIKQVYQILPDEGFENKNHRQDNYRFLFIVGMPRSGTTLVEQILSSHPDVFGAGEMDGVANTMSPILQQYCQSNNKTVLHGVIDLLRKNYLEAMTYLNIKETIITDKLPLNFMYIGFILMAFPNAKIIHLCRDPVATCWSNYRHYFSSTGHHMRFSYKLVDVAQYYIEYRKMMEFWSTHLTGEIYNLNYEKLTENQVEETRRLLEFCDLPWHDACLSPQKNKRIVQTASLLQVRETIYRGSGNAWRKYEKFLQPMIDILKEGDVLS